MTDEELRDIREIIRCGIPKWRPEKWHGRLVMADDSGVRLEMTETYVHAAKKLLAEVKRLHKAARAFSEAHCYPDPEDSSAHVDPQDWGEFCEAFGIYK